VAATSSVMAAENAMFSVLIAMALVPNVVSACWGGGGAWGWVVMEVLARKRGPGNGHQQWACDAAMVASESHPHTLVIRLIMSPLPLPRHTHTLLQHPPAFGLGLCCCHSN